MPESKKSDNKDISTGEDLIHRYTRAQAVADGVLVDLCAVSNEVCSQYFPGLSVACTAAVWGIIDRAVKNVKHCNDYNGVIHDILYMSRNGVTRKVSVNEHHFRVVIIGAERKILFDLKLSVGPSDEGSPCVTIMLSDED